MTSEQLPFDLPPVTAMGRADFFEAPCNRDALTTVTDPANWPVPRMILAGPHGSGRTHLANVFAEATGGTVLSAKAMESESLTELSGPIALDDADIVAGDPGAEEALFHLYNAVGRTGMPLLLTGTNQPGIWGIALPDLASRLAACVVSELHAPDDGLLTMVLAKLFADRQLFPDPEVLTYLVRRMERSLDTARSIVAAIDQRALAERRRVTRGLAATVLAEYAG